MASDMWRWWGYKFQWMLSYYLYTFMKNDKYFLDKNKKIEWKDFNNFARKLLKFKDKCIEKYGDNFTFELDILVEWEDKCFDDISFISNSDDKNIDNIIFIQVKTKWWEKWNTIYTWDWLYKAITNFLWNINFNKFKHAWNITFFIITNKNLAKSLRKKIDSKWPEIYLDFINHIIWLENLHKEVNKEIIISILNKNFNITSKFLQIYDGDKLTKIENLVKDLKIIFDSLSIIEDIDYYLLKSELIWFHTNSVYLEEKDRIEDLCWEWIEIRKWSPEFERYEKYKNTYFHSKDWWKLIHELDVITKWKFI